MSVGQASGGVFVSGNQGNRLSALLGVRVPIMLAGMGGVSYSDLVAAVSNAGGFGTIGAGSLTATELKEEIRLVKQKTDKPFGVDVLAAFTKNYERNISNFAQVCAEAGVRAFITGLGLPSSVIEYCKQHNMLVGCVCGKISHARRAVETGCDFVIVQGTEGGGHTGKLGLMAFLPQVIDLVGDKVPVIAAGGIFDGRGVAAALALGADGVWIGTRFLATAEANTVRGFKEKILETETDEGTVITKCYTGKTCRVIANDYTREWEKSGEQVQSFRQQAFASMTKGVNHLGGNPDTPGVDPNREFMPCGQCVGAIKEILPAKVVFEKMEKETLAIIKNWNLKSRL